MGESPQNGKYEKSVQLKSAHWMGMYNVNLHIMAPWSETSTITCLIVSII